MFKAHPRGLEGGRGGGSGVHIQSEIYGMISDKNATVKTNSLKKRGVRTPQTHHEGRKSFTSVFRCCIVAS